MRRRPPRSGIYRYEFSQKAIPLAENEMETTNSAVIQFVDLTTSDDDHRAVSFILVQ